MLNEDIVNNYKKLLVSEGLGKTLLDIYNTGMYYLGKGTGKAIKAGKSGIKYAKANPGKVIGGGLAGAGLGYAGYKGYQALSRENSQQVSIGKNEEKKARKQQLKAMQTRLRQEMSNIRTAGGDGDDVAIRAQAIKNLSADQDFVGQANELGYSVGKVGGSESGMFGYRHETGAAAEKARKESEQRLRQLNPITPQMQAQAAANKAAIAAARQQPSEEPRKPFRYVNPNSPEGRIEAQIKAGSMPDIWARDSAGRLIPGQGVRGGKLPMDLEAENKAAGKAAYDASLSKSLQDMDAGTEEMIKNLTMPDGSPISDQEREGLRQWTKERSQKVRQNLFR